VARTTAPPSPRGFIAFTPTALASADDGETGSAARSRPQALAVTAKARAARVLFFIGVGLRGEATLPAAARQVPAEYPVCDHRSLILRAAKRPESVDFWTGVGSLRSPAPDISSG